MFLEATIIGRLAHDPELEYTEEGLAKVEFAVVDDHTHEDEVQYLNVVDWGKAAKNHDEYLSKGDTVAVMGGLDLGKWEDQNGKTRWSPQILAGRYGGRVVYLGGGEREDTAGGEDREQGSSKAEPEDEEDLPF